LRSCSHRRKRVRPRRLIAEQLEDRTLLAALPPQGLVSWYRAEGNANDFAGSNNGTLMNGATFAAGKVGQAFSLDGVNDVVQVPDAANLDFAPTAPMTVELWAYRTAASHIMHFVGKRSVTSGDWNYQLAFNTDSGEGLTFLGGPGSGLITGVDPIPLNTWTHIAGTFDGTTFRLYVNGQLLGSAPGTLGAANTEPLK